MSIWLTLILKTFLGFTLLLVSTKIMGKREIGQLSIFDFLIVLSVADIMIIGIENYKESSLLFIIPMSLIVLLQVIVSCLCMKFPKFRDLIDGKESIIIKNGKIQLKQMKKEKYNMSDLYVQLREKNIRSIDEVQYAILENNGKLNVFTFNSDNEKTFPLPLIISGKIEYDNLKLINKTEKWLMSQLNKQKINSIDNIFGASLVNNQLEVVLFENSR